MEMQASRTLSVSQSQAWAALNDPEVLKLCIPGCEKVEPTGENQYSVAMALKIGPVSAKFAGKITLSEIVPPESYTIAFDGSGGVAGFGKGNAQVKLVPLPADATGQESCELHYTVHATMGGKIAQLGQRLIDGGPLPHSARMTRQNNVMGEGPRYAAGQSKLLPLDVEWDKRLVDGFASGDLTVLDGLDDETITRTGGRGGHEVRCWIAALAALGQGYRSDVLFYEPIPEWLTGMGIMTATPA